MTDTVEVLRAAKAKILSPAMWSTRGVARNSRGERVKTDDPSACLFDLVGAVLASPGTADAKDRAITALERAVWANFPKHVGSLSGFNDNQRHRDVIFVIDYAIAAEGLRNQRAA